MKGAAVGRLEDRVAIITGASSGVGRAAMQVFAREGARVCGVARTQSKLDETLRLVKDQGGEGTVVSADLSADEGAERTVQHTLDTYGKVDILVNNAGVGYSYQEERPGTMNAVGDTTPENWQHVLDINLNSVFYMCRHVLPLMQEQSSGSIVNVASISGFQGLPVAHTYCAGKGATINMTRAMATTYGGEGIRTNCVAPGYIDTQMIAPIIGLFDDEEAAQAACPMGRPAQPEEIANACLFFATDEASYCNGAVLAVDGGTSVFQR